MKHNLRSYPAIALISLALGALILGSSAFFSDRRLPHEPTVAELLLWALLGSALGWALFHAKAIAAKSYVAIRAGALIFIAVAGITTLAARDHDGRFPNANAYLTELCFSALLGLYLAYPERVEALLKERRP